MKCNNKGIPVNTILLKEKAIELSEKYDIKELKCSSGFIERFKKSDVSNSIVIPYLV